MLSIVGANNIESFFFRSYQKRPLKIHLVGIYTVRVCERYVRRATFNTSTMWIHETHTHTLALPTCNNFYKYYP